MPSSMHKHVSGLVLHSLFISSYQINASLFHLAKVVVRFAKTVLVVEPLAQCLDLIHCERRIEVIDAHIRR
jgi:hypothetical protein